MINAAPHLAAERIDLPDQVSLRTAADAGIAGHQGNTVHADSEHDRFTAQPGSGQRGLAAGMARPYNNDVESFMHMRHVSLPLDI